MSDVFNSIRPQVSFTAPPVTNATQQKTTTVADAIATSQVQDSVQVSNAQKPEKKGFVKTVNEAIGNFKKFVASAETYTVAGAKGLFKGTVAGSIVLAGSLMVNGLRKLPSIIAKKGKEVSPDVIKSCNDKLNKLAKNNKFIYAGSALVAVGTFITTLWRANLDLNEKKSSIEHRYEGHKQ